MVGAVPGGGHQGAEVGAQEGQQAERPGRVPRQRGMNISFVIDGGKDALSLDLLKELGMPFKAAAAAARKN